MGSDPDAGTNVPASRIARLCEAILSGAGVPTTDARTLAAHLTEADMMGVRSHGIMRLPRYVEQIREGYIQPAAPITTERRGTGLLRVHANRNFGILAFDRLVPDLVALAREQGVAAGAVTGCAHTGRMGAYVEAAARSRTWAQVFGGGAHETLREVAPHGGAAGVYDTNPYALAAPIGENAVACADFATSATAQGKMLVHRTNGTPVPEGWIVDRDGRDTTDADAFYDGGAMLPSAGPKGMGLAVIAELVARAALGRPHELNWVMVVIDLAAFGDQDAYDAAADALRTKIENCPPRPGVDRVMWPGQPEALRHADATREGIGYTHAEMTVIEGLEEQLT